MIERVFYIDEIIQTEGESVIDWIRKICNKYYREGDSYVLEISNKRLHDLLIDLTYPPTLEYFKMMMRLIKIKVKKTRGLEKIYCYLEE
jgi:hypothetical protein